MKLETKRLILREWRIQDIDDLVEGLGKYDVAKWLAYVPYPYTRKNAKQWIAICASQAKKKPRTTFEFAIELKSERKVIGGVSLSKIDKIQGTGGGGIWINANFQGRGFGTEAFRERIRFAFKVLKLRRLENGFLKNNTTSFKMQKKFGYEIEGLRRKAFVCMADGKIKDEYIVGLLKEDWEKTSQK